MKISIIIPVYNVKDYIKRCLQSVINQDYDDLEIILVDDASPDNSIDIAHNTTNGCKRKNQFKIITHNQNRGLSAARNTGIEFATGDYIYFLDSDDELNDRQSISILAKNAAKTKADIIIGNYTGIKKELCYESKYNKACFLTGENLITAFVKGDIPITAWNKLISNRFFINEKIRFKEGILNEDELFSYQLLFMNPTVYLTGTSTYRYYIREGSIMTTFNINRLISPITVYEEVVKSYLALKGNNPKILINLDHFAFKRYVYLLCSEADEQIKQDLYKRLRKIQKSIRGIGIMRYVFNSHLFMPSSLGYIWMKIVTKKYAKTRSLI